ncbi:MAG: VanZ family protein [bacterium]|nr:VanZ family protein [bacterium]
MNKEYVYLLALIAAAAAIMVLSVIPDVGEGLNSGWWKHLLAYFVLSMISGLYFRSKQFRYSLVLGTALAVLYGTGIEFIQLAIPYRSFQLTDMLFNCTGACMALIPLLYCSGKKII